MFKCVLYLFQDEIQVIVSDLSQMQKEEKQIMGI